MSYDNLTTYTFKDGEKEFTVNLNTYLLTGIIFVPGKRYAKDQRTRDIGRKKYLKKYPILSKFYIPSRFWANDYEYKSEFDRSHLIIKYCGKDAFRISFSSNDSAKIAHEKFKKDMWK
jgi:hypothetical protein